MGAVEERVVDAYWPFFRGAKPLGAPRVQHRPWLNMALLVGCVGGARDSEGSDSRLAACMRWRSPGAAGPQVQIADEQQQMDSPASEASTWASKWTATSWAAGNRDPGRCVVATVARNSPISQRRREQPGLVKTEVWDGVAVGKPHSRCIGRRHARQQGRPHSCGWMRRGSVYPLR